MERNTEQLRQSNLLVAPDNSVASGLSELAQFGQTIIENDQKARIANATSQVQMDLTQQSQEYRQKNAGDPFANLDQLKEDRKQIIDKAGEGISPFFTRQWQQNARELATKQDVSNEVWAYEQTHKNTINAVNNSMQLGFQQANIDGQNFANGSGTLADAMGSFAVQKAKLGSFGSEVLGDEKTAALMKTHDKDYMKSFLAGVAETAPQKAAALLNDPQIKDKFTTQERGEFVDIIDKTQKQQELAQSLTITQNTQQVTDLINDPQQTYFNKRLQLDKLEQQGAISTSTAEKARRVLTSQKDVDAVTNSDEMGDVIQKVYDLNANASMSQSDYLSGVRDIHNLILEKQAAGLINGQDVIKLNHDITTLTDKRISDATKSVGFDMSDATDQFNALPPEYRGQATRQLFYATSGQRDQLTDDQFQALAKNSAKKIVDDINNKRRLATLATVNSIQNIAPGDVDFLKQRGYTLEDVQQTAKTHKVTPAQVIQKLKDKAQQAQ